MYDIMKELPEDYQFTYLFVHPNCIKKVTKSMGEYLDDKRHIVKGYFTWGTVGYLLTLECAKLLLEEFRILEETIDGQLSKKLEKFKCFSVKEIFLESVGQLFGTQNCKIKSNIWGGDKFFN